MTQTEQIAREFLAAWGSGDQSRFEAVLADEVGLRFWGTSWLESARPRARVLGRLLGEWRSWPDASLEILNIVAGPDPADEKGPGRAAVEFRIQGTENGRYVERYRSAFLTLGQGRVETIDLYDSTPVGSAHRHGWMAPPDLTEAELGRLLEAWENLDDPREQVWPNSSGQYNLRIGFGGSGDPHPGSNGVGGARWTAEEADARIDEIMEHFRGQKAGFRWFVGPLDTPPDLAARLERHGLALAGSVGVMVRQGLNASEIPHNPELEIERVTGWDDRAFDDLMRIMGETFHMTAQQVAERRVGILERMRNPKFNDEDFTYLVRLEGKAAAYGRIVLKGGLAYLGGAGTMPEFRNRKVYSTLLRHRLQEAHARGYFVAMIHAGPMSRRVVEKYGFREFGLQRVYAWMPVMDMEVIKSLVPQD